MITIYRPTKNGQIEDLIKFFEILDNLISIDHSVVLLGDFNFPNLSWQLNKPIPNKHPSPLEMMPIKIINKNSNIPEHINKMIQYRWKQSIRSDCRPISLLCSISDP